MSDGGDRRLVEAEARYRAMFEHARDALLLADDEGRYVDVNPSACDLLGYTREELLVLTVFDLTPADVRAEGRQFWRQFLAQGRMTGEYVLRRKDGSTVPAEFSATAHVRPGLHLSIVRDISERRAEVSLLQAAEERFRWMVENSSDIISILDADGIIQYQSPSVERILGYRPEELIGRNAFDFIHPDDLAAVAAAYNVERRDIVISRYRFRHKDGTWCPLESSGSARESRDGSLVVIVTTRDLTEREEAERALQSSRAQLESVISAAPIALFSLDADGVILSCQGRGREGLGIPASELIGRKMTDVYAENEQLPGLLRRAFAGESFVAVGELRGRTFETLFSPHFDPEGKVAGVIGIATDITEQRQLEEQLRQAQKLESIGLLAGGIAHDFNNMLTAITGYAELILEDLPPGDPLRNEVSEISRAAERAALLTYQLLAFSRKQILSAQTLSLDDVLVDISRMMRRLIGEDIHLELKSHPDVGMVHADPGQIAQVVMNLLVNARDAMPSGGTITIELANAELDSEYARRHDGVTPGPYVMLAVSDTGTGMPPDVRERIFEPFFTTKPAGKGTGMGLSTVYGIVRQSGGHIYVYSEVGRGSTFKIYLPRVRETPSAGADETPATALPRGTETVLLVEDEELVRGLTRRALESCGYTVLEAANGQQALALCDDRGPEIDLLITDVVMPGLSGRELVDQLASRRPDLRVLYMSGYTDDAVVLRGVLEDSTPFLQKPFTMRALAEKVRAVLDEPPPGHVGRRADDG